MTVKQLLGNMSQKELCNWIAFFHIENEEYEKEKKERQEDRQSNSSTVKINQDSDNDSQLRRDQQMLMQLMALSGQKD